MENRRAGRVHGIEQIGLPRRHRREPGVLRRLADEPIVGFLQPQPVGQRLALLDRAQLQRGNLRHELARRAHLIRERRGRVMVARDEPPQFPIDEQRQGERRGDTHVLQILGIHQRGAAQRAVGHGERAAGVGVDQGNKLHRRRGRIGEGPHPDFFKNLARRPRDVFRRIVQAEPRSEVRAFALADHLAVEVRVKAVDHNAIEPGERAHLLRHDAVEVGERLGRVHSRDGFFHQRVVVR